MITSLLIINQLEIDWFSRLTKKKQICYHFLEIEIDLFLSILQWEKNSHVSCFCFFKIFEKQQKWKSSSSLNGGKIFSSRSIFFVKIFSRISKKRNKNVKNLENRSCRRHHHVNDDKNKMNFLKKQQQKTTNSFQNDYFFRRKKKS